MAYREVNVGTGGGGGHLCGPLIYSMYPKFGNARASNLCVEPAIVFFNIVGNRVCRSESSAVGNRLYSQQYVWLLFVQIFFMNYIIIFIWEEK
jgi:hypothetical protein